MNYCTCGHSEKDHPGSVDGCRLCGCDDFTSAPPSPPSAREESGMEVPRKVQIALDCSLASVSMHPGDEDFLAAARETALADIAEALARARREGIEEARSLLLRMDEVLSNVANPVPGSLDPLESLRADIQRFLAAGKEG